MIMFLMLFIAPCIALGAAGTVEDMKGSVTYRDRNNVPYKEAVKGTSLEKGFWVKTGEDGWAVLALSDGSTFTLANNTELEITDYNLGKKKKDAVITMNQGKLKALITKLPGGKVDYKVKSPTAVAGVRGTEFMMMAQGQANVFFGNEGSVGVGGNTADKKTLGADTMVQNTRGYSPVEPVDIKPDTPLFEAKKAFEKITAATPPTDWEASGNLPHIIARWNINHGHYLADAGKYDDALYVFQIALDLTSMPEIRSDARLERGAVYASFLKNPEAALAEYLLVIEEYPRVSQREVALYQAGRTLQEMGYKEQARERLNQYRRDYPAGKFTGNVETMLNVLSQ
jgi:tetratricopeptide (TPR) repeat protein